jgi:DnaJ domain
VPRCHQYAPSRNSTPAFNSWFQPPSSSSSFSSSKKRNKHEANLKLDKSEDNPFRILNVQRTDSFKAVKTIFLKLAMAHHPDRCSNSAKNNPTEQTRHKEIFMAARKAFEQMMEGPDGLVMLKCESEDYQDDQSNMDASWFKHETGYDMPFMDQATMKEVAKMTEDLGSGLDRDGGMWTLAKMVTNAVNSGGDATSILRLEAGDIRDRQIDGMLRRKRKR